MNNNILSKNFKSELVGRVVATVAGALVTIILARIMSPTEYGILYFCISIFVFAQVFSKLGIAQSAAKFVSEDISNANGNKYAIIRWSLKINSFSALVICGIFIIWPEVISDIVSETDVSILLFFGSFFIFSTTLTWYCRIILQSLKKIRSSIILHVIDQVCRLIFAPLLVILGLGAVGALIGYIFAASIASLLGLYMIFQRTKFINRNNKLSINNKKKILEYNMPLTLTRSMNKLDQEFDIILVGYFLSPLYVSQYVVSKQIVEFLQMPATSLGFTLSPDYGSLKSEGDIASARSLYSNSLKATLTIYLPLLVGTYIIAEPFILNIFGREYIGATPILQIFSIYALMYSITQITDGPLNYLGKARARAIGQSLTSILNLILNLILIPLIGVIGAAIATVITHSMYVLLTYYIIASELEFKLTSISTIIIKISIISIGVGIIAYLGLNSITGFVTLIIVITIAIITWATLSIALGLLSIDKIIKNIK